MNNTQIALQEVLDKFTNEEVRYEAKKGLNRIRMVNAVSEYMLSNSENREPYKKLTQEMVSDMVKAQLIHYIDIALEADQERMAYKLYEYDCISIIES